MTSDAIVERTWESELLGSVEEFALSPRGDGFRLSSRTLILYEGTRVDIEYTVDTNPDWSTRRASIDIPELATSFEVEVEPGHMSPEASLPTSLSMTRAW